MTIILRALAVSLALATTIASADPPPTISDARDALRLAEARAAAGAIAQAFADLERAAPTLIQRGDARDRARYWGVLGETRRRAGDLAGAETALKQCRQLAREAGSSQIAAVALNGLGLAAGARGDHSAGVAYLDRAAIAAGDSGNAALQATAAANAARLIASVDPTAARTRLANGIVALAGAPPSRSAAFAAIAIGDVARPLDLSLAVRALKQARAMAGPLADMRAASYALGLLGAIAEGRGDYAEAYDLTQQALGAAAAQAAPELDYRWRWQEARLARGRGLVDDAIVAYGAAIDRAGALSSAYLTGFASGRSPFREAVEPLFLDYVDLLTAEAANSAPVRREALLGAALEAIERLKAVELIEHFGDDCLAGLSRQRKRIDQIADRTATIYPVLLEDRLIVIAGLEDGQRLFEAPISRAAMTDLVHEYRRLLEKRTTREYIRPAGRLYDLLIRPALADLKAANVETLVITPDGPLRTAPLAALHDGERHLIESFSIAVTAGLDLIDPRPLTIAARKPILLGVTEAQEGFSALPAVGAELEAIAARVGGEILVDAAFTEAVLKDKVARAPYTIVHIASHGEFEPTAGESYVLTSDGRLTLDELEAAIKFSRFRDEPIELLTLSACNTAAGDDRAALGLAGVAVKAGARSALASLWTVNDAATSALMARFYDGLLEAGATKAASLRAAQRELLTNPRTAHPAYWSPFILIGNWL